MKRGRGPVVRDDIKNFLAGKKAKGKLGQMNHAKEERMSYLLSMCPSGLLSTLVQNTPGLYEKEIFAPPATPFGEHDMSSYVKLVEFLALTRPDEYNEKVPSNKSFKKKTKEDGTNTALKQRSDRMTPMSRLFEEIRNPTLWENQVNKIQELVKLCQKETDADIVVDRAQYIIQRCVNGVFSDHLYKSIVSARLLVQMTTRNQSKEFSTLITKNIRDVLQKIIEASQNSISRGRVVDLEGIAPQKLYLGAVLLAISLQLIDQQDVSESNIKNVEESVRFQFHVLHAIYTHCASIRGWCFSLMCILLSGLHERFQSHSTLLPLIADIGTCLHNSNASGEYNLLTIYFQESSHLSSDTKSWLEENNVFKGKLLDELLACVKSPHGIFVGHNHINRHPFFKDLYSLLHLRYTDEKSKTTTQYSAQIQKSFLRKLDFGNKMESLVGKFFCDTMCHCWLSLCVGPAANEALYGYYTYALETFGNYALPAVKTSKSNAKSTSHKSLIAQFHDLTNEKYYPESTEPSMEDFTVDSTDEEDAIEEKTQVEIGIENQAKEKRSYFANFMRSNVLQKIHQVALQSNLPEEALGDIFTFFSETALALKKVEKDDLYKETISHRSTCIHSIAAILRDTEEKEDSAKNRTKKTLPEVSEEKSKHTAQILIQALHNLHIDTRLSEWKNVYCEFSRLSKADKIDGKAQRLCLFFSLHCAWEELGHSTSRKSDRIMKDMATVAQELQKTEENTEDNNLLNAFQRLYSLLAEGSQSTLRSCLTDAMEGFWVAQFTERRKLSHSRLFPIISKEHCRGQTIPGLFVEDSTEKKKGKPLSLPEAISRNQHTLKLLSLVFGQLRPSAQAELIFRWVACFYALASYPAGKQEFKGVFETILGSIHCEVWAHSRELYADSEQKMPLESSFQDKWCEVLKLLLVALRTQTKHPEHFRWVKEVSSRIFQKLYGGITVVGNAAENVLIKAIQSFFVEIVECKTVPTQGKKHFMGCLQQNIPLSAVCVLPGLLGYVSKICLMGNAKDANSPTTFDLQCLDIVFDCFVQTLHKVDKLTDESVKSSAEKFGKDFVQIFADDVPRILPVIASKKFLETCGATFYRLLRVLKHDSEVSERIREIEGKSMKYVEKNRIEVQPKQLRRIRNYIGL